MTDDPQDTLEGREQDSERGRDEALNDIGVLKRREIEARVIAPFVEKLCREFPRERVLSLLEETIVALAAKQGTQLAKAVGGSSPAHFAESLENWKKDDALELKVLDDSPRELSFDVTRCRFAEMYHELGIPELGAILSCSRDFALSAGFNPSMKLRRTQTILGGASHCDFRYRVAAKKSG